MTETLLARDPVARVQAALIAQNVNARIQILTQSARTAEDAAKALDCPIGAIVKSLLFRAGNQPVLALIAGDKICDPARLKTTANLDQLPKQANADFVQRSTGFSIGGVAPIGHSSSVTIALDESLSRFPKLWAAAGHPFCVFSITYSELCRVTGQKGQPLTKT